VIAPYGGGKTLLWEHGKTADDLAKVKRGEMKLFFLAVISYHDDNGRWYKRGVCNVYDPSNRICCIERWPVSG
jgi:hypothetical protein